MRSAGRRGETSGHGSMQRSVISIRNVTQRFGGAGRAGNRAGARRCLARHPEGRVRLPARPVRLRQEHAAQHHRRLAAADGGLDARSPAGRSMARRAPTRSPSCSRKARCFPGTRCSRISAWRSSSRASPIRVATTARCMRCRAVGMAQFANHYPKQLSVGMKPAHQPGARASASAPRSCCIDEPFAALDEQTRMVLGEDLSMLLARTGKTIVFVTHSLAEAVFLADRIVVMTARPGTHQGHHRACRSRIRARPTSCSSGEFGEIRNELYALLRDEIRATVARMREARDARGGMAMRARSHSLIRTHPVRPSSRSVRRRLVPGRRRPAQRLPLLLPPPDAGLALRCSSCGPPGGSGRPLCVTLTTIAKAYCHRGRRRHRRRLSGHALAARWCASSSRCSPACSPIPLTLFFPLFIVFFGIGAGFEDRLWRDLQLLSRSRSTRSRASPASTSSTCARRVRWARAASRTFRHVYLPAALPVTADRPAHRLLHLHRLGARRRDARRRRRHRPSHRARGRADGDRRGIYAWIAFVVIVSVTLNLLVLAAENRQRAGVTHDRHPGRRPRAAPSRLAVRPAVIGASGIVYRAFLEIYGTLLADRRPERRARSRALVRRSWATRRAARRCGVTLIELAVAFALSVVFGDADRPPDRAHRASAAAASIPIVLLLYGIPQVDRCCRCSC